jgi:N6-adenosine-specific RNA methylase IME4
MSVPTKYGAVLSDPPWDFKTWGARGSEQRGASRHYETTETTALADIPVADWCLPDAALFMWVVDSHLEQALDLGRAWGFQFKTVAFVWVKTKRGAPVSTAMGHGYWTRKETEQCWLFTRGKPKRLGKGVRQTISCARGPHSEKPWIVREKVAELVGGPYLEMFSRSPAARWDAWGNETNTLAPLFAEAAQ